MRTANNQTHPDCIDIGYGLTRQCAERAVEILNNGSAVRAVADQEGRTMMKEIALAAIEQGVGWQEIAKEYAAYIEEFAEKGEKDKVKKLAEELIEVMKEFT